LARDLLPDELLRPPDDLLRLPDDLLLPAVDLLRLLEDLLRLLEELPRLRLFGCAAFDLDEPFDPLLDRLRAG